MQAATHDTQISRPSTLLAILVAGAFFMENLDGTVIATAIPEMARSFGVSPVSLNIGMTAYMLTLAVFIPISGWVADRFGPRLVFTTALAVFTISSVLCGLSSGLGQFTAARVVQGIGGAMMVPVGRVVVLRSTRKEDLMTAIAYLTWPGLVAPVIGPPLGGFLTTYTSWHWIFFLNVPLGLLGIFASLRMIPRDSGQSRRPLDLAGFLLLGSACAAFLYGLDSIPRPDSHWLSIAVLLTVSAGLGALAARHVRRHPAPILDLSALRIPTYAVTIWGGSLFRVAISTAPFLLPLLFQIGFGMDPFTSGMLTLAVFAGNLSMKPLTTAVLRRFGFRQVLIWNGILTAVSIAACALFTAGTPKAVIAVILFASGLCRSMQFTSLNTLGFADVPEAGMSAASTFYSMMQQLSIGMGVAVGAITVRVASWARGGHGATLAVDDFRWSFVFVALLAAVSIFDIVRLPAEAGELVSRGGRKE